MTSSLLSNLLRRRDLFFFFLKKNKCIHGESRVDAATFSMIFLSFFLSFSIDYVLDRNCSLCKIYSLLIYIDDISTFIYNFISLYRLIINYFHTNNSI